MASQVEICNMALAQLRASPIVSITEDNIESQQCKLFFDSCLETVLSDGNWQFRRQTKRLTLIEQETVNDKLLRPTQWEYMYAYPSDVIKMIGVMPDEDNYLNYWFDTEGQRYSGFQEFEIMQGKNDKVIVTDCCDAIACFTLSLKDITQLSAPLVNALSHYLASKLAMSVVGGDEGRAQKRDNYQEYNAIIKTAKTHDVSQKAKSRRHSPIFDSYE